MRPSACHCGHYGENCKSLPACPLQIAHVAALA